jgi:hypothetical protein
MKIILFSLMTFLFCARFSCCNEKEIHPLEKAFPQDLEIQSPCVDAIRSILQPIGVTWVIEDVALTESTVFKQVVKSKIKKGTLVRDALLGLSRQCQDFNVVVVRGVIHCIAKRLNAVDPLDEVIENFEATGHTKEPN